MGIAVNSELAREMIAIAIRAELVAMVKGSPGTGKSAIIKQLAEEYGLLVIDLRLSQCDPTDLLGFPNINDEKTLASYIPMSTFPTEDWTVPKGYNGWLLFLDEMNSADRGVQKAAYKLVLDKMVGEFKLHPRCAIVGAGNLDTDGAIVEEQSTAMQSRLIHINLAVENDPWLRWASRFGIDHRITDYIKFKPGNLYNFNPDKNNEDTYACFRTWEFVHDLLTKGQLDITSDAAVPLLAGTIGEGVAIEFVAFVELYKDLPSNVRNKGNVLSPSTSTRLQAL
jgi:hypothetical protein